MGAGWAPFERKAATMVRIRRMEDGDTADIYRVHTAAVRQVCAKTVNAGRGRGVAVRANPGRLPAR